MRFLPATLRYALRRWRHRPGLALTATLVLALGIGATTAMFSIVDAVLLKEEPWPNADRLVRIHAVLPQQRTNPAFANRWNRSLISRASWRDLQALKVFTHVAAWVSDQRVIGEDRGELATTFFASSGLPGLVGAKPAAGRFFNQDEDDVDSGAVIISHRLWSTMFGRDPDAIGKTTIVSPPGSSGTAKTERRTIVGVMPAAFAFPGETPDLLMPLGYYGYVLSYDNSMLRAIAKLGDGISERAALAAAEPAVRREEPPDRRTARIASLKVDRIGFGGQPLWLMLAGAALLLAVACSNVAGLLLSDARSRHHETAVRLSLGGTRAAVLRQLLVEHATLAVAAGVAGVLLAYWLIPVLTSLAPPGVLGNQAVALDRTLAGWSIIAAVVTTMLAGVIPESAISSTRPGDALKSGAREATRGGRWGHRAIVAAQFALALVLLVGAALFGETLLRLSGERLGFQPEGVVIASVTQARQISQPLQVVDREKFLEFRKSGNTDALIRAVSQRSWIRFQPLLDRLSAIPGVSGVAASDAAPFATEVIASSRFRAEGSPVEDAASSLTPFVTSNYFDVLGIPLLRGRAFDSRDLGPGVRSVMISAELERRLFDGNGLGRTIVRDKATAEVIGVVADVKQRALAEEDLPTVYYPMLEPSRTKHLLVRSSSDPDALLPALRPMIEGYDAPLFVTSMSPLGDLVATSIVVERGRAMLSAMYGGVALLLASVGLYGLAARLVAERRREIGIRIALGAGRRDVRRLVMVDTWLIITAGLVVGFPSAFAASRLAQGTLYGVQPAAPHVLGIAATTLAIAAIVATFVPVWRANRIDPAVTLRQE